MEKKIEELSPAHSIRKKNGRYTILLNKPPSFIYDVSDILVEYDTEGKGWTVHCAEIPKEIQENMLKFQGQEPADYIAFLEENLGIFCMGRTPCSINGLSEAATAERARRSANGTAESPDAGAAPDLATPSLLPSELPKNYKFPLTSGVASNVKYEASKKNVFIFTCKRISVTAECSRCKSINVISESAECRKCATPLGLTFVPVFDPAYLGFLALKRCSFVCFNPTEYQYSCSECQSNYETRPIGVKDPYVFRCYHCSADIRIKLERLDFMQKKEYNLKAGTELPSKGTCRHYKKSQRWFRFSCCNSLYPCDICHDEESGHPHEEARRMVCGLCSKEQSVKSECECGMSLKKTASRFWEGGKGNRNKATMSRKDTKKYSK